MRLHAGQLADPGDRGDDTEHAELCQVEPYLHIGIEEVEDEWDIQPVLLL